jgi:hypothetical protein
VDPDSDPDPAFQVNPGFPDPKIQMKNFWIKNCNLHMSKLQEKPSALKREYPALQKRKFVNFFIWLRFIFALLDPDPDCK